MKNLLRILQRQLSGEIPDWDRLEEELIQADFGVEFATRFVQRLRQTRGGLLMVGSGIENAREELEKIFRDAPRAELTKPLHVVLIVGVNGVGKTTSAAKLAFYWKQKKKSVRLVAADTFRAAAIEQLQVWAERIGCAISRGPYGMDPAALAYQAVQQALEERTQLVIIDTAGRQANKKNLMQELAKIPRVLKKLLPEAPQETLLVIDAHTGSNAYVQARQFSESLDITGLIATKMDGCGNGGPLVAIATELGLLPHWVGNGERLEDFQRFQTKEFLNQLFAPVSDETTASD